MNNGYGDAVDGMIQSTYGDAIDKCVKYFRQMAQ